MSAVARSLVLASFAMAATVRADVPQCHVVDVRFTPAMQDSTPSDRHEASQIVVWLERPDGTYLDTLFVTQQVGRYGLGNRPGRYDFNSGPMWPYGRRTMTFPVWSHRQPHTFPTVIFQNCCFGMSSSSDDPAFCTTLINDSTKPDPWKTEFRECGDNNLSHPFDQSSREQHFCQPFMTSDSKWLQADAMTCATIAYTDKGKFSATATSLYPPRTDLIRVSSDSPSVDLYKQMNPYDAVSQATPPSGESTKVTWPIPQDLPVGDYVLWVEVAQAFDFNDTYSSANYPAPPSTGDKGISWATYGLPFRGQPSLVYRVPFTLGTVTATTSTDVYAGYGDPDGVDGALHPPDATITTGTPGTGESRLQLISEGGTTYRVQVTTRPEYDYAVPDAPEALQATAIGTTSATLRFIAPGDDGLIGTVSGYEIRYLADRPLTPDNFAQASSILASISPLGPGRLQTVDISGLLPETEYWIGVRAFDDCRNTSPVSIIKITTADRVVGEVDACFVATAAYGSIMANDVELLRHFRDTLLRRTVLGELAIETYYTFGPAVAGVVGESNLLRTSARDALRPLIAWVRKLSF